MFAQRQVHVCTPTYTTQSTDHYTIAYTLCKSKRQKGKRLQWAHLDPQRTKHCAVIGKAETQYLDEAKIDALRPPKQDRATAMGMVQLNMPNVWSANVWGQSTEGHSAQDRVSTAS